MSEVSEGSSELGARVQQGGALVFDLEPMLLVLDPLLPGAACLIGRRIGPGTPLGYPAHRRPKPTSVERTAILWPL